MLSTTATERSSIELSFDTSSIGENIELSGSPRDRTPFKKLLTFSSSCQPKV